MNDIAMEYIKSALALAQNGQEHDAMECLKSAKKTIEKEQKDNEEMMKTINHMMQKTQVYLDEAEKHFN